MATKITEDMIIADVIALDSGCAPIFFENGLHCVGCPSSSGESIRDIAEIHGIDLESLLEELNEYFEEQG